MSFSVPDAPYPVPMHAIDCKEYGILRKLSPGVQCHPEGSNLAFFKRLRPILQGNGLYYRRHGRRRQSSCHGVSGQPGSCFRCSLLIDMRRVLSVPLGEKKPFAMFHPLTTDAVTPPTLDSLLTKKCGFFPHFLFFHGESVENIQFFLSVSSNCSYLN